MVTCEKRSQGRVALKNDVWERDESAWQEWVERIAAAWRRKDRSQWEIFTIGFTVCIDKQPAFGRMLRKMAR